MLGPEPILTDLGIVLTSAVDPARQAILETDYRIHVNDHFFWTDSTESAETFRKNPHLYTGPVLDPVSNEWFSPTGGSPRMKREDRILLFASRENMQAFD